MGRKAAAEELGRNGKTHGEEIACAKFHMKHIPSTNLYACPPFSITNILLPPGELLSADNMVLNS